MISVCMATYNGEKFVKQQLESILIQLSESDEVIIVDDCSRDNTVETIQQIHDERIKLTINNKNCGPISSFETALKKSSGEYIFLADQDDYWLQDKVKKVMHCFQYYHCGLVVHDALVTNTDLKITEHSWNEYNHNKFTDHVLFTLMKNPFTGANMAFSRKVLEKTTPFPTNLAMHDWWVGLICQKSGIKIHVMKDALLLYRRHDNNVTGSSHDLKKMITSRVRMLFLLWRFG